MCSRSRGEYDRAKKAHSDAKAEWQRAKDNQLGDVAVAAAATAAGLTALVTTAPVGGIGAVPAAGIGGVAGGISGTVGGIVVTSANIWRLGRKKDEAKRDCENKYSAWANCMWRHIQSFHYSASGTSSPSQGEADHTHSVPPSSCN